MEVQSTEFTLNSPAKGMTLGKGQVLQEHDRQSGFQPFSGHQARRFTEKFWFSLCLVTELVVISLYRCTDNTSMRHQIHQTPEAVSLQSASEAVCKAQAPAQKHSFQKSSHNLLTPSVGEPAACSDFQGKSEPVQLHSSFFKVHKTSL